MFNISSLHINENALQELKSIKPQAESFYRERIEVTPSVNFDVSSSTYRVFKKMRRKPSMVFKSWGFKTFQDPHCLADIKNIQSRNGFEQLHAKYAESLSNSWLIEEGTELAFPYKNKLIDLFFKALSRYQLHDEYINHILLKYAHIPLDSITFRVMDKIFSGELNLKNKTMGYVKTPQLYKNLQDLVYNVATQIGMSPLHLDFYSKVEYMLSKVEEATHNKD